MGKRLRTTLIYIDVATIVLLLFCTTIMVHETCHVVLIGQSNIVDYEGYGILSDCYREGAPTGYYGPRACILSIKSDTATQTEFEQWKNQNHSRDITCMKTEIIFLVVASILSFRLYFSYLKKHRNFKAFKPGE